MDIDMRKRRLIEADRRCLWHPFTQMKGWQEEPDPLIITGGRGPFVMDMDGRWLLDGVSSLWVNIHGHGRRELDEALTAQLGRIAHSTMLGASSEPAIELAARLSALMRSSFGQDGGDCPSRVFYSDNGSTAVEVALKMAFQYWLHKGERGRTKFVRLERAYHGDTLGAVSVGGMDVFHAAFGPLLFETYQAPAPYCYRCTLGAPEGGFADPASCGMRCLDGMRRILAAHAGEVAGVIVEPLIQCAGGMIVAPGGYLAGLRRLCDEWGVLLIADEVATGFGRTGRMFACEREGVSPDIICLSKGITGGYMPLAATIAREFIYEAFLGEFVELKTFFHGHSYTGNPLGCAVALASLDIFEADGTIEAMGPKVEMLGRWLGRIVERPGVGDARGVGLMAGVELVADGRTRRGYPFEWKVGWQVAYEARRRGLFIRPLGNVMVIMPPLVIEPGHLGRMLQDIEGSIETVTSRL